MVNVILTKIISKIVVVLSHFLEFNRYTAEKELLVKYKIYIKKANVFDHCVHCQVQQSKKLFTKYVNLSLSLLNAVQISSFFRFEIKV